jgi:hypothetical protein
MTLVDLLLVAALIVTGVLWVSSRSAPAPDSTELLVDLESATIALVTASAAGDLGGVKAALNSAAEVAATIGDSPTAGGLRQLSAALADVEIAAVERALAAVNPLPNTQLFADLYIALWTPLFYPDMPIVTPVPGAEAAHVNYIVPRANTAQYWGTTIWSMPANVPESFGEADVDFPEFGLTGKLMFAHSANGMQITFVFQGPHDDAAIAAADGFWIVRGADAQSRLLGDELQFGQGFVALIAAANLSDENAEMLRDAAEIVLPIEFEDGERYILRFEVGETGRAVLTQNL